LCSDFINENIKDVDWASRIPSLDEYLTPEFKQNGGMGLMCDFTERIDKVFTTVFLSENVLTKIIDYGIANAMILSHHPTDWDLKNHNGPYSVDENYFVKLRERNISVFILHNPLDDFGEYSTCNTLADMLGINIIKPVLPYLGASCGVIGTTEYKTVYELNERYSRVVGHETKLYQYGNENIRKGIVAVCSGGGNFIEIIDAMIENDVNTLITGVSLINDRTRETHEYEKMNKINLLGGTHYSSEKFAVMKMCGYFNGLGLSAEFIEDEPDFYDL